MTVFSFFENLLKPTALPPDMPPPSTLGAFYWHYAKQARGLVIMLFVVGFGVAALDTTIPVFIGKLVKLISTVSPDVMVREHWPQLLLMALVLLVARPAVILLQNLLTNQAIAPGLTNVIRWQSYWHVVG